MEKETKKMITRLIAIAIVTGLYMLWEYFERGYFALGAEILFTPLLTTATIADRFDLLD